MEEIWLPVVGFEGYYEVSSLGRVRSLDRVNHLGRRYKGRVLRMPTTGTGHRTVRLMADGRGRSLCVHVLVAEAFLGPRPEGYHTHHLDGDRSNNRADNLQYLPPDTHKRLHGWGTHDGAHVRGERNRFSKLTEAKVRRLRAWAAEGVSSHEIARRLGVHERSVRNVLRGRAWQHVP